MWLKLVIFTEQFNHKHIFSVLVMFDLQDSAIPTSHGQDGRHSGRMGVHSTGIMYGSPTDEEEESEGEWMKEKREERVREYPTYTSR